MVGQRSWRGNPSNGLFSRRFLSFPMEHPPWLGNRLSEYGFYFFGTPCEQIQECMTDCWINPQIWVIADSQFNIHQLAFKRNAEVFHNSQCPSTINEPLKQFQKFQPVAIPSSPCFLLIYVLLTGAFYVGNLREWSNPSLVMSSSQQPPATHPLPAFSTSKFIEPPHLPPSRRWRCKTCTPTAGTDSWICWDLKWCPGGSRPWALT